MPELLQASDLMLHPARNEATGTVLLESIACGCPVLCSDACGFASYVRESGGLVLTEPFSLQEMKEKILAVTADPQNYQRLKKQVLDYAAHVDFNRRASAAVDNLENFVSGSASRKSCVSRKEVLP